MFFTVAIATFPGELLNQNIVAKTAWLPVLRAWLPVLRSDPATNDETTKAKVARLWVSPYEWLFLGEVNEITATRNSLWSNTLVLTNEDFVEDDETLDKIERTVPLRGRDLRGAVLVRTDLRKADFTGAILDGADLRRRQI